MTKRTECTGGGPKLDNGNCTNPGPDGLPVQCVGIWATDKHHYLRQYIGATRSVRKKFLGPGKGGAAFIDIFAGPGMVRVRDTGDIHPGSPLIALQHREAPFSKLVFADREPANVAALQARTASDAARVKIIPGDSNANIDKIASQIPEYGLNIALVDPFALSALKFRTLERLGRLPRMDLIIHFPTGDIKRNVKQNENTRQWLTEALGTDSWMTTFTSMKDIGRLIELFKEQLSSLGYGSMSVPSEPIKNNKNLPLYYLVYASKNPRGDAIWKSITKNKPTGQRGMGW
ncbi:MAG: three-Cys-motif partner protein TcmP [Candidatus Eisenbacteria bacterium]|nr:three-Cys-motif partner protein TcmP [Candidatus Eisenbacteria bacterium]